METRSVVVRVAWLAGLAFFLGLGAWEFASPRTFYDALAVYPPFNAHFLRDGGAFTMGIGAGMLAGARWRDGLTVALVGAAAACVLHTVSHVVDVDAGGRPTDPWLLGVLAAVVTTGAVLRVKEVGR